MKMRKMCSLLEHRAWQERPVMMEGSQDDG